MKISVIGNGHIGAGLARAWVRAGHTVVFGSRTPQKSELLALCSCIGATARIVADAAVDADVVVLAVPYPALDDALLAMGDLDGKIVVDCTNAAERGMVLKYGHTTSAAEELQKRLPKSRIVKSFNAQGAENLARPVYGNARASNLYCGNDIEARSVVQQLIADVGFDPVDAGPLSNARYLEPMMLLWVATAQALGTRDIAFQYLRRA
jgi:8-hydroxy-5-deazaflavin:NADPH oxidoreductase